MADQIKLLLHFIVAALIAAAVPLVNTGLAAVGMHLSTTAGSIDAITNDLFIGGSLAYFWWLHHRTAAVHGAAGFDEGQEVGYTRGVDVGMTAATRAASPDHADPVLPTNTIPQPPPPFTNQPKANS